MGSKNAVVTGVAGFIGSNLAEKLLEEGYSVTGIDNFDPYYSEDIKRDNVRRVTEKSRKEKNSFELVNGSINRTKDLEKLPKRPEKVFHLAAKPGTRSSINQLSEYKKTNVKGTSRVLNYFKPVKKFVYMSSSSIYGEKSLNQLPVNEEDSKRPENPYAKTKLKGEKLVKNKSSPRFDTVILRPFSVFGPRQRPDEVFTSFISNMIEGKDIRVYGDGSQSRDFTFVDDIVNGTFAASEQGSGVYNLGKGERNTVQEIIDVIDRRTVCDINARYESEKQGDVAHTHADIGRARDDLGFNPTSNIASSVEETINWVEDMKQKNLL